MRNQNAALHHHLHYVFRNYAFAYPCDDIVPLGLSDRHLLASLLQKAIRRGESEIARAAARALLRIDPRRLFRRLGVIAFEDIGLGDCDLGLALLAASANARWREGLGGKDFVVDRLVLIAARTIKERSADHLWSVIRHDPEQENEVRGLAHASRAALLGVVSSSHLPLAYRARAALVAAGRHPKLGSTTVGTGDVRSSLEDECLIEALKLRIETMNARLTRFKEHFEKKRQLAAQLMESAGIGKIEVVDFAVSLCEGALKADIFDPRKLPADYLIPVPPQD